jgi:hypothetical protein
MSSKQERFRIAVLDDYQDVALSHADWSVLNARATVSVFNDHLADSDAVVERQQHSRPGTRYQTDLSDAEWRVIAPQLPKPCATGRPRELPMRESVNRIFYVMRAGCPWCLLPSDLPPWGRICRWFVDLTPRLGN